MGLWNLIKNENMKLYKRKMVWVIAGVLFLTICLTLVITINTEPTPTDSWEKTLINRNAFLEAQLLDKNIPEDYKESTIQKEMDLNNYRLEHNISPLFKKSALGFVQTTLGYTGIITLFIIILASSIVSQEYSWGTIKLLLMKPIQRWKFLLAKFIAILWNAFLMFITLFILSLLIGVICFGFDDNSLRYVYTYNGEIKDIFIFTHFLQYFGSKYVGSVMVAGFAFMISTIFKNNTLAISLSIIIQFAGSMITGVLSILDKGISKYIFFNHTNLYQFIEGTPPDSLSLLFSIVVLFIYFVLFMFISIFTFEKRDIT
jgi:ABC-2 type transport system permease protein